MRARRARFIAVAVAVALPMMVACTRTTDGTGQWVKDEAPELVEGNDIEDIVLDNQAVSAIIDADISVIPDSVRTEPLPAADLKECDVMRVTGQRGLASDFEAFTTTTSWDRVNPAQPITRLALQTAIVYESVKDATKALGNLGSDMEECDGREVTTDRVPWKFSLDEDNDHTLRWTATQRAGVAWACAGEVRARQNVVLRVYTCRDDGKEDADTQAIADSVSQAVSELSAPER